MPRHFDNWLKAFIDYSQFGEAPRRMYFWTGVSAIAGALRRRVWIDQAYFRWYPNFYICMVAPPGIVSKSTTVGIGMNLLRRVPGIRFGPEVVTWQAMVTAFAESTEAFEYKGDLYPMSALTFESSEFGNLLNPEDKEMVDMLVSLWDGKEGGFQKKTKFSGADTVENPWINLIACTTPAWVAGNFPEYMIGGGFTSRCIFVYADKKQNYVAYPGRQVPKNLDEQAAKLVEDLTHISEKLVGEYKLTDEAIAWGESWYQRHYSTPNETLKDERLAGYLARKQTHIHKLAMVLAAAESDDMIITEEHLIVAETMVTDLEPDMAKVFVKIGKKETSVYTDRFLYYIRIRGKCTLAEAYRYVHSYFPRNQEFTDMVEGCIKAGYIRLEGSGQHCMIVSQMEKTNADNTVASGVRGLEAGQGLDSGLRTGSGRD